MGKVHFTRDNHTEFLFGDLLNSDWRLKLSDFDAEAFIFQFDLLSFFLRGDEGIAATRADTASDDDSHSKNREDQEKDAAP